VRHFGQPAEVQVLAFPGELRYLRRSVVGSFLMAGRHKILLLDDDQDLLELYREMLGKLPSQPEIHTATSGARAIALLEAEPFALLISDLNMPRMDGLQVLTIVRRKFPHLRTAVMTSVVDTQFRARAYQMGIDLFLEKPNTQQEVAFFMDCIESLLGREADEGFRGVQSKSLVDIIQLECLSQSNSTLKVTHGAWVGKIWFANGDVVDAEAGDMQAEDAFRRVLSWRTGSFEILPAEPSRPRRIFTSYQGLLLESAQALDEAQAGGASLPAVSGEGPEAGAVPVPESRLAALTRLSGVEFAVHVPLGEKPFEARGVENPETMAGLVRQATQRLRVLGESLGAGPLGQVECLGAVNHLAIASRSTGDLCIGFSNSMSADFIRETMPKILERWDS
jgi:CheY-like chemotaxis protein